MSIGRERLADCLDDRDAACDRGLETQRQPARLRELRQLDAMEGEQRLIGGDDMFAGVQRGLDRGPRGALFAAHQFDKNGV